MAENKQPGAGEAKSQHTPPHTATPSPNRGTQEARDRENKGVTSSTASSAAGTTSSTAAGSAGTTSPTASGAGQDRMRQDPTAYRAGQSSGDDRTLTGSYTRAHDPAHSTSTRESFRHDEDHDRIEKPRHYDDSDRDKSSAQLEREVEYERHQLTRTLDQIRTRVSPGQIMDQAFDYARDAGGGDFVRNLGRSVRDNPLPVLLVGAGIGWLMMSNGSRGSTWSSDRSQSGGMARRAQGMRETMSSVRDRASSVRDKASGVGDDISERAGHAAQSASDTASGLASSARAGLHRASESASSAYRKAGETGSAAMDRARDSMQHTADSARSAMHDATEYADEMRMGVQRNFKRLAEEQPLVLGAIGIALGAAIAAMLPPTRVENRLMGSTSDALKDQARSSAKREYEHARDVAQEAARGVSEEFEQRGMSAQGLSDAAAGATRRVGDAAKDMAKDAKSEVRQQGEKSSAAGSTPSSSFESGKASDEPQRGSDKPTGSRGGPGGSGPTGT